MKLLMLGYTFSKTGNRQFWPNFTLMSIVDYIELCKKRQDERFMVWFLLLLYAYLAIYFIG